MSDKEQDLGKIVEVKLRNRLVKAIIYSQCEKPTFKCEKLQDVGDGYYPKSYMEIFKFLSAYYSSSFGDVVNLFTPFSGKILCEKSSIKIDITLSDRQQEAYDFILSNDISLLFGDTGSGKSEIYMKLFELMINEGKTSIFLMPEISLTPQMLQRVQEHFGDSVAIWHSKITKKRKQEVLEGIKSGKIKIVAGARSALFLPLENLGLIVVDEEHDDSYKSAQRPRYHARDVALYMGKVLGAKVLLGSATPSLTSYDKFPFFRLKGTFHESKKRYIYEECESKLTQAILKEIDKSLKNKKQIITFLPTRANYKYLNCYECGAFVECPYCSVGMSIHQERNALICHYCNFAQKIAQVCPSCKSQSMRVSRIGTAEVVKELSNIYKDRVIAKFDTDEITTQTKLKKVLKEFNDKKIDVLVGTQMLSKGHNYLDVDLAVVLGIDTLLAQSDYRAREKAMSLLLQIAGRSGRSGEGRVLIQTQNREFFERYLGDYEEFLKEELAYRKSLYPPYKKLMKVQVSGKYKDKTQRELEVVRDCLEACEGVDVIGSGEAPIAKIASKFRFQVLLRSSSAKALLQAASQCKCSVCEIDIDPVSFS
jgi:primosomal protein N' (replication factor Y)